MSRLFFLIFYLYWGTENCSLYQELRYIEVSQHISDQFMSGNL